MSDLRDYQVKIVSAISREIFVNGNKKILVYSSTGSGKTVIAKHIIQKLIGKGSRILFTVPRRKLAIQTLEKFGFGNLIMGAETKSNGSLCTIATIQSMLSMKIAEPFDYIIIDEAHFGNDSEYLNYILKTYSKSIIIALSATPLDENGYLISGYDALVNVVNELDLIRDGWLCDVEVYTSVLQPELQQVQITNGDYNQEQANKLMTEQKILTNTVQEWERLGKHLKTLVFACNIDHAEKLAAELKTRYKVGCVHSKMSETEIETMYRLFNRDEIRVLINVDMATFGFDEPSIECLLFARPVKSLRLYKQMVGRGLRIFSGKRKCLIIDCADVIRDNGYPTEPIQFNQKPVVSKKIDSLLKIERDVSGKVITELPKERVEYLTRISSILDLYSEKTYIRESDLMDDVRTFLRKTTHFHWRQNSGTANIGNRWVQFTDKKGLPDITLLFHGVYVGIECKLEKGTLTDHQKQTLPDMINRGCLIFICKSVLDLFEILEHMTENITVSENSISINRDIFTVPQTQINYRIKYKLPLK